MPRHHRLLAAIFLVMSIPPPVLQGGAPDEPFAERIDDENLAADMGMHSLQLHCRRGAGTRYGRCRIAAGYPEPKL